MSPTDRIDDPRDRFFAVAAHQLRTPLTPLLMLAHLLEEDATLPPPLRPQLAMMRENIETASRLIDELADLGRFRTGQLAIEPVECDVTQLLHAVLECQASDAQLKRVAIHRALEAPSVVLRADAGRLQRVIETMVSNAVLHSPRDQVVHITLRERPEVVELTVQDHGRGWPRSHADRVFDLLPGEPNAASGSRFGIGLALGRRIAELHGGRLTAHSDGPGKGAVFTLTLPSLPSLQS